MAGRSKLIDITGHKYGRLTVLEFSHFKRSPSGHKNAYWKCKCDCGKIVIKPSNNLRNGNTRSCGCFRTDENRRRCCKPYPRKLIGVYRDILTRCYDPNFKYFDYYGGRGIGVCDKWLGPDGADNFRNWAIRNGYEDGLTIDRIDNDKGYSPDNCRWVDRFEQGKNKRNNVRVTINGETKILAEWCRVLNVPYARVKRRRQQGWSVVEALLIPPRTGMSKEKKIERANLKDVLATAYSNVD